MPSIVEFKNSGLAVMLLGTFAFSVGSVFIKLVGARIPALEIVFARSLIMTIYCYWLARRAGAHMPGHRKPLLFLRGILGFGAYFCIFYAMIHMPLADATVISLGFPVIVPIWATLFLGEKLHSRTLICIAIGAAGMVLVTKPPMLFGGTSAYEPLAVLVAVGAAVLSSICVTLVRALTSTEHPLVIVLYAAMAGTIGAPLIGAHEWLMPTAMETLLLIGVGLCMSVGQHCVTIGYSRAPASTTSVFFYTEVVFAAIFGLMIFGTIPDTLTIAGSALIIAGAGLLGLTKK